MTRQIIFLLLFSGLSVFIYAGGINEKSSVIEVTGRVRLVGSSPVSELVITGTEKEWYIPKKEEYKLKNLQHQTVTVKGEEIVENLTFANGFPAGERRTLKNIKIVKSR